MWLTKDGITLDVFHPTDIAKYKRFGYVKVEDVKPIESVAEIVVEPVTEDQQAIDQATVEEIVQPEKAKKGKVKNG